jgi:hypothetical protein
VSHDRSRAGGDGTGSSTGRTGHRSTAASIVRRRAESARPPLRRPGCPRPDVRSGSVPRNASRPHQDLGALGLAGALCAPGYTKRSRKPGSSPQMMLWLTSGHDVPQEAARSDHRFTVASMTSRRAGRMCAELAWSPSGAGVPSASDSAPQHSYPPLPDSTSQSCRRRIHRRKLQRCAGIAWPALR